MDEQVVRMAVEEVMDELDMSERRFEIVTTMAAPNPEAIQLRVFDHRGEGRSVTVDLGDKRGQPVIYLEEIKDRIREQLRKFAADAR